jgi:hypothetical protein
MAGTKENAGRQGGCLPEKKENIAQRLFMKTFMKTSVVAAVALAMTAFGTPNARAWGGWPIAAGVAGGLAVGVAVASANAPVYTYPVYPAYGAYTTYGTYATAPAYITSAPAVQQPPPPVQQTVYQPPVVQTVPPPTVYVQRPAPVYYYSSPVIYAAPYSCLYGHPYVRYGWSYPRRFVYRRW